MLAILFTRWHLLTLFRTCEVATYSMCLAIPVLALALTGQPDTLLWWVGLWLAAFFHSFGHLVMTSYRNECGESITVLPFFSTFKLAEPPHSSATDALVTAAGPLANLALAGLIYSVHASFGAMPAWLGQWATINLAYGVITLLPMYPLDGSRLLRLVLQSRMDEQKARNAANFTGQSMAAAIVLWSFYQGFYRLGFIGIACYLVGRSAPLIQLITRQGNLARAVQQQEIEAEEWADEADENGEAPIVMTQGADGTWEATDSTWNASNTSATFSAEGRTFF